MAISGPLAGMIWVIVYIVHNMVDDACRLLLLKVFWVLFWTGKIGYLSREFNIKCRQFACSVCQAFSLLSTSSENPPFSSCSGAAPPFLHSEFRYNAPLLRISSTLAPLTINFTKGKWAALEKMEEHPPYFPTCARGLFRFLVSILVWL